MRELQKLVEELQATNSKNKKMEILAKYPQCKELLMYTYNPFYQFHVKSKTLKKKKDLMSDNYIGSIKIVLDTLRKRELTGHAAIAMVNTFIDDNEEYADLIYNIIDKNLKVRIDSKLINKVFPDLVPMFELALAESYDDHKHKVDFNTDIWLASRKLNGVRCVIRKENGKVKILSRTGKEFWTLDVLKDAVAKLKEDNFVLDGEACLIKNGLEDFQGIMKEIRKKNHTIKDPKFIIFDKLTLEEFDNTKGTTPLVIRLNDNMKNLAEEITNNKHISILEHEVVESAEHLEKLLYAGEDLGWEGRIIRKNAPYEGKRSNNMLKVKLFKDAEYKVLSIETGSFRIISPETGLEETITTMVRVNIEHKGNIVGVGSGWNLEQRKRYFANPDEIIGKIITVQYKEETQNQDGNYSLQFPTIKCVHGDERDT